MDYIKGVNSLNRLNNFISNNSSYKSVVSIGNNISTTKPKIKINITELKNEFINKELKNNLIPKCSSIRINKYKQGNANKSARIFSLKTKIQKNKIKLNKLNIELNTKKSTKKIVKDLPNDKIFQKTSGNYFSSKDKSFLNFKEKAMKTPYKNKFSKLKNLGLNITNTTNNNIINNNKIENSKIIENIYSSKIKKILKDGKKEIDKIKKDFAKHFTTNNSPYKSNKYLNKEKNKLDSTYIMTKQKKKIMKKTITDSSNFQKKTKLKYNNKEPKTQRIKQLTQKNSKQYMEIIPIPKLKTKRINIRNNIKENEIINTPSLTNTSRSILHDSLYYLKESQKLSEYIKNYYKVNKKYPETNLDFYKYGRLIGQGAFGKVNLGLNVLTGRVVAIKSFNKSNLNSNSENMKKIVYETNLMKKLNHPNITKILELFEEKEYILIIMEYINGGNLFSFLKKHRTVSEKTAKLLYKQIILGIKYMHEQNIVHRDIKLENILIDLNNNIKICDFGIGRVLSSPDQPLFDQCGTPMYIAPEILLCSKDKGYKGFPVDIWSSGIVLYILLSGTLPFSFKNTSESLMGSKESKIEEDNNNSLELQYSIVNNEPKEIENLSNEGKDLLSKILQKDPKKRITCEEILNHPWMKGISNNEINSNKYHLFTKAEINILSKTYVDYRKDKNDNLKEAFTLANLFIEEENNNSKLKEYKNEETKSSILAPFNSVNKSDEEEDIYNDEIIMDDFINNKIRLENGIIIIGNKVKEFNMLYELNNNCEVDNGIIINSRTNTISSKSDNNSIYINNEIKDTDGFIDKNEKIKDNKKNEEEIEKILNEIELLGYDKKYVKECVDKNILCHASAAYYLMINYDNI
jgi:MAP/microtubule affinity-regulating kinase